MSVIELSMTTSYVKSWTLLEAVREILQNSIDQEAVNPENKMSITFSAGELRITNALSVLYPTSLLLGASTKADDNRTIGKFGEGYKLALLVLCRLGYEVEILNYSKKERWTPFLKVSRNYGAEVLAIRIGRFVFTSVPDANLTFVVRGISTEDWEAIKSRTLQLCNIPKDSRLFTPKGYVLLGSEYKGQIFVNGLYICKAAKLQHGYNFTPGQLTLDRDRNMVRDFDLQWLTSSLWAFLWGNHLELAESLIEEGAWEVNYLSNHTNDGISSAMLDRFPAKFGEKSVPVTNEIQSIQARRNGLNPIIVPTAYYETVIASSRYSMMCLPSPIATPQALLQEFYDKYSDELSREVDDAFMVLIELAANWRVK